MSSRSAHRWRPVGRAGFSVRAVCLYPSRHGRPGGGHQSNRVNKIPQVAHGVDRHGQPEEFGGLDSVKEEVCEFLQPTPVFLIAHRASRAGGVFGRRRPLPRQGSLAVGLRAPAKFGRGTRVWGGAKAGVEVLVCLFVGLTSSSTTKQGRKPPTTNNGQ